MRVDIILDFFKLGKSALKNNSDTKKLIGGKFRIAHVQTLKDACYIYGV